MRQRLIGVSVIAVSLAMAGIHTSAQQSASQTTPNAPAKQTAQSAAPDLTKMPLMGVNMVQIKPDLITEWQEFQKNEVIPTLQKGGVKQRTGIVTAIGPSFEYVFLTPLASFADRDGDSPIVKALGQEGARAFGQKNRRFIASQRTFVVRVRTDLSFQPDPNAATPIAVVSAYSLAAGRAADFANYIKADMTAAHKQLKTAGFLVYQGLFGGDGNEFIVASLMHDFAELDKGPAITQAYGAARAAAIQQKLAGIVTHVERTVSRRVPELSFQARTVSENR